MGQVEIIKESKKSYFVSYAVGVNTHPGGDETALIVNDHFFILNGRWVDEYKKCKTKEEQVQLFRDNYEKHGGFWTESLEELDEALKTKVE